MMNSMVRKAIPESEGASAVRALLTGSSSRETIGLAVRYLLQLLAERAPGNTVEVRVPPFGAVQCIPGPRHTRGTPPNVIEMSADTWCALATGAMSWDDALASGAISASGQRASLAGLVPVRY